MRHRKKSYLVAAFLITAIVILIIINIVTQGSAALKEAFTNPIFIIVLFIIALLISVLLSYVYFVKSPMKSNRAAGELGASMVIKSIHLRRSRSQIIKEFKEKGYNKQEIETAMKEWEAKAERMKKMNK